MKLTIVYEHLWTWGHGQRFFNSSFSEYISDNAFQLIIASQWQREGVHSGIVRSKNELRHVKQLIGVKIDYKAHLTSIDQ